MPAVNEIPSSRSRQTEEVASAEAPRANFAKEMFGGLLRDISNTANASRDRIDKIKALSAAVKESPMFIRAITAIIRNFQDDRDVRITAIQELSEARMGSSLALSPDLVVALQDVLANPKDNKAVRIAILRKANSLLEFAITPAITAIIRNFQDDRDVRITAIQELSEARMGSSLALSPDLVVALQDVLANPKDNKAVRIAILRKANSLLEFAITPAITAIIRNFQDDRDVRITAIQELSEARMGSSLALSPDLVVALQDVLANPKDNKAVRIAILRKANSLLEFAITPAITAIIRNFQDDRDVRITAIQELSEARMGSSLALSPDLVVALQDVLANPKEDKKIKEEIRKKLPLVLQLK